MLLTFLFFFLGEFFLFIDDEKKENISHSTIEWSEVVLCDSGTI